MSPASSRYRAATLALALVTLFVVLWGSYVRASFSGDGCADRWPLCDWRDAAAAQAAARPVFKTFVEGFHRLSSGLALVLAVYVAWLSFREYPRAHRMRALGLAAMGLYFFEAAIGAGLVLLRYVANDQRIARGYWMGAHLISTYALMATVTLLALGARGAVVELRRERGPRLAWFAGAAIMLIAGVSGAIAALGVMIAPSRSLAEGVAQDLSPSAHVFVQLRVLHPVGATLAGLALIALAAIVGRRDGARARHRVGAIAIIVVVQLAYGALNLVLHAPAGMQVLHLAIAQVLVCAWTAIGVRRLPADPALAEELSATFA